MTRDPPSKNVGATNPAMYNTLEVAEGREKEPEKYSTFDHVKGDRTHLLKKSANSRNVPPVPSEEYGVLELVKVKIIMIVAYGAPTVYRTLWGSPVRIILYFVPGPTAGLQMQAWSNRVFRVYT